MAAQNFPGSLPKKRDVGFTNLTLKFVPVPLRVDRSRDEGSRPLHAFEVGLLHNLAQPGHFPSSPTGRTGLSETASVAARPFSSVFYCFRLQGSQGLPARAVCVENCLTRPRACMAAAGFVCCQWRRGNLFVILTFEGVPNAQKIIVATESAARVTESA